MIHVKRQTMQPLSEPGAHSHSPQNRQPILPIAVLTMYVLFIALSGFTCGVRELPWWYQLLVAVTPVISIACLWTTNLVDPGVLPPNSTKDDTVEMLDAGMLEVPGSCGYQADASGTWMRQVESEGQLIWQKYCRTCNIWRSTRGHHCNACGYCMDRFDHHCAVVGTCVARLNHRFFAAFLLSAQAGTFLLTAGSAWRLHRRHFPSDEAWDSAETYLLLALCVIYGYHTLLLLFGTSHCLSIVLDVTTKDMMDCRALGRNLPCCPGSRSPCNLLAAWRSVCCGPVRWRPAPRDRDTFLRLPLVQPGPSSARHHIV